MDAIGWQAREDGLRVQAGWCASLASALAANSVPTGSGSSALASAAAVDAAHAQVAAAGLRCATRVQATATKLTATSARYGVNEARSADEFRALVC
ncbi:hypothetical protein [Mycobacterium saskatchewanense]|uniref:hypothetical protein n=1 Tax=Mycobacterium saskatchewanense TaxID=220927 RepID=UPI001E5B80D8|nr:hypothetical protein [Mycobacterium saskatchewanense]